MDIIKQFGQQGDVLIKACDSSKFKGKPVVGHVLAEGELTGHAHRATGDGVAVMEAPDGTRVLSAPNGAEISHEEHGKVAVAPGTYEIGIVQEYDHFAEEARAVQD
tara:strand:- start:3590 stop:3907 length:318 start_codon:yes stop_codon:yes gene_type:complete